MSVEQERRERGRGRESSAARIAEVREACGLEVRGHQIVSRSGGVRPATAGEQALWRLLITPEKEWGT